MTELAFNYNNEWYSNLKAFAQTLLILLSHKLYFILEQNLSNCVVLTT